MTSPFGTPGVPQAASLGPTDEIVPSQPETPPTLPPFAPPTRRALPGSLVRNLGLVLAILALFVVGTITAGSRFASIPNFLVILTAAATIGVISVGMTFVITGAGIDLSVGSVLGLSAVWASTWATQDLASRTHWIVIVITAVVVGAAAGLVNGLLVAYGKVVAFIATLAMMVAARGLAEIISAKRTQVVNDRGFLDFMGDRFLGLPMLVWISVAVAAGGWVLLNRTTFGRRTIAVGGNPEAARLAGINVRAHTTWLYVVCGACAGIAAVMMLSRTTSGSSTHGMGYELDAIAAVVVGGTLLVGGRGTIVGTIFGVLVFATLSNLFTLNNLSISAQAIAKGVIIVVAVLLQQQFAARSRRTT